MILSTYIEEDRTDPHFREITKHCVIYEIDKDGQKTLFRHFLLLPNGTIIEVFEQFKITLAPQVIPLSDRVAYTPTTFHFRLIL